MAYMILEKTTGHSCGDGRIGLPFRWVVKESTFEIPLPSMDIVGLEFAELIPITQDDIVSFPNEFRIDRTGSCNRCGYCCGWIDDKPASHCCVHIVRKGGNKGNCGIYANLTDLCTEPTCSNRDPDNTHSDCIPPPHQPYHKWNGLCGYTWTVTTTGLPITNKEIIRIYWAVEKDLTGKWIRG